MQAVLSAHWKEIRLSFHCRDFTKIDHFKPLQYLAEVIIFHTSDKQKTSSNTSCYLWQGEYGAAVSTGKGCVGQG